MRPAYPFPAVPAVGGVSWPAALAALALTLVVLGFAFTTEITAALDTWESSTAYNHCWLVLPVALWLAWARRDRLRGLQPEPWMPGVAGVLLAGLAWLMAERLGIMEGRQLAVLGMVWGLVLSVLGWPVVRAMAAPLLYLVFLVPFGEFMTPLLQRWTAWFIVTGLNMLSIPNYHDDLVIEIPAGTFLVAEACAGLRFMVAALAFGALYALAMFRSPWRRLAVMVLAMAVPLVANGIRALGIVLMGHYLGSAEAAAADHVLYGWIFFSIVILLLVVAGLPFREDGAGLAAPALPPSSGDRRGAAPLLVSALLGSMVAAGAPALAAAMDRVDPPRAAPARLAAPEGCLPVAGTADLRCEAGVLTGQLVVFSAKTTWSRVSMERRRLSIQDDEAVTFNLTTGQGVWHVRQDRDSADIVAVASWLDGRPAGDGIRSRLSQAMNSILGGGGRPVIAAVTLRADGRSVDARAQQRDRLWMRDLLQGSAASLASEAASLSR